ncbi:hypothetical protein SSPSH_003554 [Salinisphaera shabanensis E1L3A]|jgi:uncharacterized membrane protein|uniref:Uncharacterized protein n=1 Tax=Salinisphaera shabanensis E1L3A TaxID=1033802 RepID=U2FN58_9GAMM|nr:hypothetical protein [Salinisphaera shabanensis]ERJ17639.1 hypothetical protein SSPSH_003554 [Salinisphaera shabanensis E1L3A]
MNTAVWIVIVIAVLVAAFGILNWVRRQIAASREDLKHVDRSKLRDLDKDAWAEEERDKDDWKS